MTKSGLIKSETEREILDALVEVLPSPMVPTELLTSKGW
jgi:hypothetical protein